MALRTPLARVRGLGSAKEGTAHFWRQRLTSVAAVPLSLFLIAMIIAAAGADHDAARALIGSPLIALGFLATVIVFAVHMRLGMQVIVEDYVHHELSKVALVMLNTSICYMVGLVSAFAILKLSFGA